MRIVAGRLKGRALAAPAGRTTRPTSDKARQAVFNKLEHGITDFSLAGIRVADLFAGSGALGLEALSRGAGAVTFVERDRRALAALRENLAALDVAASATVLIRDATRLAPADQPMDLVFLDAPYGQGLSEAAMAALVGHGWLAADAVIVVEIGADEAFAPPPDLTEIDRRRYGAATIVFLRAASLR